MQRPGPPLTLPTPWPMQLKAVNVAVDVDTVIAFRFFSPLIWLESGTRCFFAVHAPTCSRHVSPSAVIFDILPPPKGKLNGKWSARLIELPDSFKVHMAHNKAQASAGCCLFHRDSSIWWQARNATSDDSLGNVSEKRQVGDAVYCRLPVDIGVVVHNIGFILISETVRWKKQPREGEREIHKRKTDADGVANQVHSTPDDTKNPT